MSSPFAELAARARALGAEDLLDVALARWMQSSGLSVRSWALLEAFSRKEGHATLADLLDDAAAEQRLLDWRQGRHAATEVCQVFGAELDRRRTRAEHSAEAIDVPRPPVGRPEAVLRAWAAASGVEAWLDVSARKLDAEVGGESHRWLWWYGDDGWTLGGVLTAPRSTSERGSRTAPPRGLQEAALRFLHAAAVQRATGLQYIERAAPRRAVPPGSPPLARLHGWLTAARVRLDAEGAAPLPPAARGDARSTLREDPPTLQVVVHAESPCPGPRNTKITVDLADGGVRCACAHPSAGCALRLAAVDAVLDAVTGGPPLTGFEPDPVARLLGTPAWERELQVLDRILGTTDTAGTLGWRIKRGRTGLSLEPVTVSAGERGSTLAPVPLDRALGLGADPADRRCADLLAAGRDRPGAVIPQALVYQALEALAGHPRVFGPGRRTRPTPVSVHALALVGRSADGGFRLEAEVDGVAEVPPPEVLAAAAGGRAAWITSDAIRVLRASPTALGVLLALAERGGGFPAEAADGLFARLPALADVVDVRLEGALGGTPEPAEPRVTATLARTGTAFRVTLTVAPAPGYDARAFAPRPALAYRRSDARTHHVRRDIDAERDTLRRAAHDLGVPDARHHAVDVPLEAALEVVARATAAEIQVAWTSDAVRVAGEADATGLELEVRKRRDWFGLDGTLTIGPHQIPLRTVLTAIHEGRRWVEVEDGAFARLSDALVARLQEASGVAVRRRTALAVDPIHAPVLERLATDGASVALPKTWRDQTDRIRAAVDLQPPVPADLSATLRPYQLAGFVWLARLATWAPGAVLADDMGLGKTLQALALLLERAPGGPALVVAPTSVGFNWIREAARFAPTLSVRPYRGPDRAALLEGLGPGEVLVTSYGLLRRDAELLGERAFHTVVLDEAQAIKNPRTRGAKAAHALRRDFCLALTGTPVENRIAELWSLFAAVVPGLLGSYAAFRERWATPIERDGDTATQAALARLIAPFLLRRKKGAVAKELPERLEVVVEVELSDGERRLYEDERLAAARRLVGRGEQRMEVLAALTRLRQLACHPRLVDPDSDVPSAKLARLRQLVADLVDAGHRALVFSQFTRHLGLVREALTEDGHTCRYLDGSTPAERRREEVDAFQDGEGDVFLISLKAGGTGLNLTAATFVVHLDPWWNPAAEDQATDRAHRIGQTREVTVYRLVTTGTVEESILQLHAEKRALADAVVGGAARVRLDTDELIAMLGGV